MTDFEALSDWGASVAMSSDGGFTYSPGVAFQGLSAGEVTIDQFRYTVSNGVGAVGSAVVRIEVSGANDGPTAVDDLPGLDTPTLFARANVARTIQPIDVLGNDVDVDVNDVLAIVGAAATSDQGALITVVDGSIVYDASGVASLNALAAGQRVADRFTYTMADAAGVTSTATIEITVQSPLNVDPAPTNDAYTFSEDGFLGGELLANDNDSDALPDDPALSTVAETVTSQLGATVTIQADGTFEYDASGVNAIQALQAGETIGDSFVYQAIDFQGGVSPATAQLTLEGVNDSPTATPDEFLDISGDSLLVIPAAQGLLSNDFDPDSPGTLQIDTESSDTVSAGGARVVINPDGSFEYDPAGALDYLPADEVFVDTFQYTVIDDQDGLTVGTATVEVIGVNDAPVGGADGIERGFWTVGSQRLVIPADQGLLINDTDVDLGDQEHLEAIFAEDPDNPGEFLYEGLSELGAVVIITPDGGFTYDPTGSPTIQALQDAGQDVIDRFNYGVMDANCAVTETVVEIILRSGPSGYSFDVVASGGEFGEGPSINNYGNVAYQATDSSVENIYIWNEDSGAIPLVNNGFADRFLPSNSNPGDAPFASFSEIVQINDSNYIAAQRQLNALGVLGVLPLGLPIFTFSDFVLTYVEHWNGQRLLDGEGYGLPEQVAVGDSGIAKAGIRWGHPLFLDMFVLGLTSLFPGAVGFALAAPFTLQPRVWLLNPVWASVYFSPVDAVWNVGRDPDDFDFDLLSGIALATSLVPGFFGNKFATPVRVAYPNVTIANPEVPAGDVANTLLFPLAGGGEGGSNDDGGDNGDDDNSNKKKRFLSAFAGNHVDDNLSQTSLFSYPQAELFFIKNTNTDSVPVPHMADTGHTVFDDGGELKVLDFEFGPVDTGLGSTGARPSVSDSGYVVTAADGPEGRGIYVYDIHEGGWMKVVGESQDGNLDPNETHIDLNDNGEFDGFEDFGGISQILIDEQVGLNGPAGPDTPGLPFFTASFMALNGDGERGLHTASFFWDKPSNEILNPELFLGHNRVANIGEMLPGVGTINDIKMFDPINNVGQLVFWAQTGGGEAIIRANPPLSTFSQVIYGFENRKLSENENELLNRGDDGVVVARFVSSDPGATPGQFSTIIDWGDGQTTTDAIVQPMQGSGGKPVPQIFEVIADHTYKRQGPYAAAVQIQDTENRTGGLTVSLAYAIDTTNEEDIERFNEHGTIDRESFSGANPEDLIPFVLSGAQSAFGLKTFADMDRGAGTYEVTASGKAFFSYFYKLDAVDSGGDGAPSQTFGSASSTDPDRPDDSGFIVDNIYATGTFDSVGFDTSSFTLDTYEAFFHGESEDSGTSKTDRLGEVSQTTTSSTTEFEEYKSYDGGQFEWTYDKTITFDENKTSGTRTVDREIGDQVDGLVRQSAADMSADLLANSLSGNFTTAYSSLEITESVKETGNYNGGSVDQREFHWRSEGEERTDGSNGSFKFDRAQRVVSTKDSDDGTIDLNSGEYSLTLVLTNEVEIISYTEENADMTADISGVTQVMTTIQKEGNNDDGSFKLQVETLSSQIDFTRTEENQGRKSEQVVNGTTQYNQTNMGNAHKGDYGITGTSKVLGQSTVTTQENQTSKIESVHNVLADTRDFKQKGHLYDGDYEYSETTTESKFESQVTETNMLDVGLITTKTTTFGDTFIDRKDKGNKKEGEFDASEETTTTSKTTIEASNQSQKSTTTTESVVVEFGARKGDIDSGKYVFSGHRDVRSSKSTTDTVNEELSTHRETTVNRDFSSWSGDGNVLSGKYSRNTDEIIKELTVEETTINQSRQHDTKTESKSRGSATREGVTVEGSFTEEFIDMTTSSVITEKITNQSEQIDSTTTEQTVYNGKTTANIYTGVYTRESIETTDVQSLDRKTTNTAETTYLLTDNLTSDTVSLSLSVPVGPNQRIVISKEDGNSVTGEHSSYRETANFTSFRQTTDNQSLAGDATVTTISHSIDERTANFVTGDYTGQKLSSKMADGRDETIRNQSQQVTTLLVTSGSTSDSQGSGNSISGVYDITGETSTSFYESDQTVENLSQKIETKLSQAATGGSSRSGNSVTGEFESSGFTTTTSSTETQSITNQSFKSDMTTTVLSERSDYKNSGNTISGKFDLESTTKTSTRTTGSTENDEIRTEVESTKDHEVQTVSKANDVTGDFDKTDTISTKTSREEKLFNQALDSTTNIDTQLDGVYVTVGNRFTGKSETTANDVKTDTTTENVRRIHDEETTTTTKETSFTDSKSESNRFSGEFIRSSETDTDITFRERETFNQSLHTTANLTGADGFATNVAGLVGANNVRTSKVEESGNSIEGDYLSTQTITSRTTELETTDNQSHQGTATFSEALVMTFIDTTNSVTGEYLNNQRTTDTATYVNGSANNQGQFTLNKDARNTRRVTVASGNTLTGDFNNTFEETKSVADSHREVRNQSLTLITDSLTDETRTGSSSGNDIAGDFGGSYNVTVIVDREESAENQTRKATTISSQTTSGVFQTSGDSIAGTTTETRTGVSVSSSIEDTAENQTEDVFTRIVESTSRNSTSFSNANTGEYTTEVADSTTFTTRFSETKNSGKLLVTSNLAPASTDAAEVTGLISASFHNVGNNQRYSESKRSGNSITGNVSSSLERSVTRVTVLEASSNQTMSGSALVSSGEVREVVNRDNSVTGAYANNTQTAQSAVVREDASKNQTQEVTTRQATESTDERTTSGNTFTGDYSVVSAKATADMTTDRKVENQGMVSTSNTVMTSDTTTLSESGNSISGGFTSVTTGSSFTVTDETTKNQTSTTTIHVEESVTSDATTIGNSVTSKYTSTTKIHKETDSDSKDTNQEREGVSKVTLIEDTTINVTDGNSIQKTQIGDSKTETNRKIDSTISNQTLIAMEKIEENSLTEMDFSTNDITGFGSSKSTTKGDRDREETITNQTLTVTAIEKGTFEVEESSDKNTILGDFLVTRLTKQDFQIDGDDSNGKLTGVFQETVTVTDDSKESGNLILGDYADEMKSVRETTRTRTDLNQTLRIESEDKSTVTTTDKGTGNTLLANDERTRIVDVVSDSKQDIFNQSLTSIVTSHTESISTTTSTTNPITGVYESEEVASGKSDRQETTVNRTSNVSITEDSTFESEVNTTGNSVTGDSVSLATSKTDSTRDYEDVNQSRKVVETTTSSTSASDKTTSNAITGVYTTTDSNAETNSVANQTLTNHTLTVTATRTDKDVVTGGETGNTVTGAFDSDSVMTSTSKIVEHDENQVRIVDLESLDETTTTVDHTGNRVTGDFVRKSNSDHKFTSTEINNIDPFSTITTNTEGTDQNEESGNEISGESSFASSGDSKEIASEIFTYAGLTVNLGSVTETKYTANGTSNAVLGETKSSNVTEYTQEVTRDETNQGVVVSRKETADGKSTTTDESNSISGEYTSRDVSTTTTGATETSTNQSLTVTILESGKNDSDTTRKGNAITGDYTIDGVSEFSNTLTETDLNQTRTVTFTTTTTGTGSSSGSGNDVTGDAANLDTTLFETERKHNETNQTLTITLTEKLTGDTKFESTENAFTGIYTTKETANSTGTASELATNQTETRKLDTVSESTSYDEKSGNFITGDYATLGDATYKATLDELLTNQTLTVTSMQTELVTTDSSSTGNERFRDYDTKVVTNSTLETTQTSKNQTSETTGSRKEVADRTVTTAGNSVTGVYVENSISDVVVTIGNEQTVNQTSTVDRSQDETTHTESTRSGNSVTGAYTLDAKSDSKVTIASTDLNTDQNIVTTDTTTSESTRLVTGNAVTGDFDSTSESSSVMTVAQDGTLGTRTFTASVLTSKTDSKTVSTGNDITGKSDATTDSSEDYSYEKSTTYPDGSDSMTVDRLTATAAKITSNSVTGDSEATSQTTTTESVAETGQRANSYTRDSDSKTVTDAKSISNAITGTFDDESLVVVDITQTRKVNDPTLGSWSLVEVEHSEATDERDGNSITGDYASKSSSMLSIVSDQTTTSGDGSTSFTVNSKVNQNDTADETGNSVTGDLSVTIQRTRIEDITQNGVNAGATISYVSHSQDDSTLVTTGNVILGVLTTTGTGVELYDFEQSVAGPVESYTLDGEGRVDYSINNTLNTITGEYTKNRTGQDDYLLTQTGTDATGAYTVTIDGLDDFVTIETGNAQTGVYDRTTTGTGEAEKSETRNGSTTLTTVTIDYSLDQQGNYLDGEVTQSTTGDHRYSHLPSFMDTSNGATGTAGALDFSMVGAPLMFGAAPPSPTGGAMTPATPAAVDAIFSSASGGVGSMADPLVRGPEAFGMAATVSGAGLSYASVLNEYSELGTNLLYEYCFAKGTEVLMADGSTKPIEEIQVGDWVLAAPERDPLAPPQARQVRQTYHNQPAGLLNLHFDDALVRTTKNHPFFVADRGWIQANELRVGDRLRTQHGDWRVLTDIFDNGDVEPVFNLQVDELHTYFVSIGDDAVLAHNTSIEQLIQDIRDMLASIVDYVMAAAGAFADAVIEATGLDHVYEFVVDHAEAITAAVVSIGLVVGGVALIAVTGGAALPLGLVMIGAGIGGAWASGLLDGSAFEAGHEFSWTNYLGGAALGAAAGALSAGAVYLIAANPLVAMGVVAGMANGALQTYAMKGDQATVLDYAISMGLGGVFGGLMRGRRSHRSADHWPAAPHSTPLAAIGATAC